VPETLTTISGGQRLESLDVFRGLTIAAMILVSAPGTWDAVYWPLDHATWNGWTPTDLVFPFLLFAMGAAVPVALARRRGRPEGVHRHVIRRAVLLFGLGLLLNAIEAKPPLVWTTFPILGVLQRIAIVYAVVAWLTERTSARTQVVVASASLIAYWAAMTLIPVPGVGAGVLTPDGNLATFIDRRILGLHLSHGTWESEGLLSTIPAIATALCGVLAGEWLMHAGSSRQRSSVTLVLWSAGAGAMLAGLIWDRTFPINKNLWTSSFVLLTAGAAAQVLAVGHLVVDVHQWRRWAFPFVAFGRNPLAVYFLSVAVDSALTRWIVSARYDLSLKWEIYWHAFGSWAAPCCGTEAASLLYAIAYVALWTAVAMLMYRRRVFVGV
jgi:predicted acyltransferase